MISLHSALARDLSRTSPRNLRMIIVRPPALCLLPARRVRPRSLITSFFLHAIAMAALVWLPRLFPSPVVIAQENFSKSSPVFVPEPLILPALPKVEDRGSAGSHPKIISKASAASPAGSSMSAPPRTPDYTAPQTIVSDVASPVNRVQTILRPDLIAPPSLKFPLRMQSVVILPSSAAPVLAPQPPQQPVEPAPAAASEEAPAIKATAPKPVLTLTTKKGSVIQAKAAPPQNISPNLKTFAGTNSNAIKALVVVNAVEVAPAPATAVPEGQLAGKFVVGPSGSGTGSAEPLRSSETPGAVSGAGHSPAPADGHSPTSGSGTETAAAGRGGNSVSGSPKMGTGGGAGTTNGAGAGTGVATGPGTGAGKGTVSSGAPGISISGGVSGGTRAGAANSFPGRPSYPLMIISGGASGGASRDLGVFGRHETVYSVSIPMADSGGGPDWTMQYALLDPAQAGTGLLVPPIAQRKTGATMKPLPVNVDAGPVFVSAIINEKGKLESLRALRAQDTRSQAAIRALEQWEFLPAQLDGKPVSAKILMGIAVRFQE